MAKHYNPDYAPAGYPDYPTCAAATIDPALLISAANAGFTPNTAKLIKNQQAASAASKGSDPNADYSR